jgi:hypothetical protein
MLERLLGIARADVDRQIGWVGSEVKRQTRYTAMTGGLAAGAAFAALGAVAVGLIALDTWLGMRYGSLWAHGMIGGGLLLVALILGALAFARNRPKLGPRPALQSVQPAALLGALKQGRYGAAAVTGDQVLRVAADTLRTSSRPTAFGVLAVTAVAGLIIARELRGARRRRPGKIS